MRFLRLISLALMSVLVGATTLLAQTTNVTLNVTDLDGQAWFSVGAAPGQGTWSAVLTPAPGTGPPFFITGTATPVPNQQQSGTLNGSGSATMTVNSNNLISPAGSVWAFTVCPQATSVCFTQNATIQGATQTLNLTPPAIRITVTGIPYRLVAYTDAEIVTPAIGAQYYNLVSLTTRTWNGSVWGSGAGAGGTVTQILSGTGLTGGPITTTGTLSLANTAVTPGPYTYGSFTVDQQGRLTAASSGIGPPTTPIGETIIANTAPTGTSFTGTPAQFDLSVFAGADPCAKIETLAIAVGVGTPTTIDARGLVGTFSCSPTNTIHTWRNVGEGTRLKIGNITLKLGSVLRNSGLNGCGTMPFGPFNVTSVNNAGKYLYTNTPNNASATNAFVGMKFSTEGFANGVNDFYDVVVTASDTTSITFAVGTTPETPASPGIVMGGPGVDCWGAWILPKNVQIEGISPTASIIQVDASGCSGKPSVGCSNWVQRSASISSVVLSGSGPQCPATNNQCWVNATVSGMTGGIAPQIGELFQFESTTGGASGFDSNWSMYPVNPGLNNPGNNGGAPAAASTTNLVFYTATPTAATNGGTVFFATCLICYGWDGTSGGENGTPYSQGNYLSNLALNTLSVAGAVGLENVAAQENTGYWNLTVKNFDFAGIAMWNVANGGSSFSNSGPYGPTFLIECQGTGSCSGAHNYATLLMYLGNNHTRGFVGAGTMVGGATGDSGYYGYDPNANQKPQCGLMIEGDHQNSAISGFHIEQQQTAVCIGYHMPSVGVHLDSFQGHSSIAGAVIDVSKNFQFPGPTAGKGAQTSDFLFTEIGSNNAVGATLIDEINGTTSFDLNVSSDSFDASPGPPTLITSAAFRSTFGAGAIAGPWQGFSSGSNPPFCYGSTAGLLCQNEGSDPPTFLAGIGFLWPNGVEHRYDWLSNNGLRQGLPQMVMLTSQYTNSSSTFSNVSGGNNLALSVAASQTYSGTCTLYYQAAATGALNIQFLGPASPTSVTYSVNEPLSATTFTTAVATAFSTSLGAVVTTPATNFAATVTVGLRNGVNAGTLQLQAASVPGVQLQIQQGSYCIFQ